MWDNLKTVNRTDTERQLGTMAPPTKELGWMETSMAPALRYTQTKARTSVSLKNQYVKAMAPTSGLTAPSMKAITNKENRMELADSFDLMALRWAGSSRKTNEEEFAIM